MLLDSPDTGDICDVDLNDLNGMNTIFYFFYDVHSSVTDTERITSSMAEVSGLGSPRPVRRIYVLRGSARVPRAQNELCGPLKMFWYNLTSYVIFPTRDKCEAPKVPENLKTPAH